MEQQGSSGKGKYKVIGTRPIRHDGEDKVTGRAQYGADIMFQDQLYGHVLRSPHAHAKILKIDTSKAETMPGVRAVVTSQDFPQGEISAGKKYARDRILASDKALFKGHPIAAVAAEDRWTAEEAAKAIEVSYEVLPAVMDVMEAIKEDAPLVQEGNTTSTLGGQDAKPSNIVNHTQHKRGDVDDGFAKAELVIEREFDTKAVHQGYIEPQNATALARSDGQITVWCSSQAPFWVRAELSALLELPLSRFKVVPMEIGGGFGGKINSYLEAPAVLLSKKTGQPVKLVMSRADVFEATGQASAVHSKIKIGVNKDGAIVAGQAWLAYESGALPSNWGMQGSMCVFAPYKMEHVLIDAYDVLTNTSKVAAYRAPSSPQAMFGTESVMDEIAQELGMDPIELRLKNAVQEGDLRADGPKFPRIGFKETLEAIKNSDHYKSPPPSAPNQARGLAAGFWFNAGMQSSATVGINMDGTASVVTGSVDIGGSRASMSIMAAEALGLTAEEVRPSVADTDSIGHTDVTGGSRTTAVTGTAVYEAAQDAIGQMKKRVAKLWDISEEQVVFEDGAFKSTANGHDPITVKELGPKLGMTGGPVLGSATVAPKSVGAGFGVHVVDIEVDPETGKVAILRYTAAQDVGTAIHLSYVEGQMQGGVVQGIGWALNEEYIRGEDGAMQNTGFLDYRVPTMLDVPNIETIIVEVPAPGQPYGVRGVGEVPIIPPLGALHNAIYKAIGVRLRALPMSPPSVVKAIHEARKIAEPAAART
ncbi:MAG: xanthine dehydrogenase family protein molybdopterin-binding subunit [SAR324 cluster bacterium]|nr:xanthine dehydrogenase family protein molybdopterin-binding subunit [SAR324 cluster bacterium]